MKPTIGFTGTRHGMTPNQKVAVRAILAHLRSACPFVGVRGVHGDCVGADADFDALCKELRIETFSRPCTLFQMRAYTGAKELAPPKKPLDRNRDIVADADFMVCCPATFTPVARGSGTWATIRYTEQAGKKFAIVFPNGSLNSASKLRGIVEAAMNANQEPPHARP